MAQTPHPRPERPRPTSEPNPFERLRRQRTVVLTTFRRDGTPVGTPVSIALVGDHAVVRSWSTSGKAKRLRRDPHATIAPSTVRGRPTGEAVDVRLRLLDGADDAAARAALRRKHPVLHGLLVPAMHRLKGLHTVHYAVAPSPPPPG
jgi:uncharacterized protein